MQAGCRADGWRCRHRDGRVEREFEGDRAQTQHAAGQSILPSPWPIPHHGSSCLCGTVTQLPWSLQLPPLAHTCRALFRRARCTAPALQPLYCSSSTAGGTGRQQRRDAASWRPPAVRPAAACASSAAPPQNNLMHPLPPPPRCAWNCCSTSHAGAGLPHRPDDAGVPAAGGGSKAAERGADQRDAGRPPERPLAAPCFVP